VVPGWLKGANLENVVTIRKEKAYLDSVLAKLDDCKEIITIGGGFIGVEVADELNKIGKDVTIVEILPHILGFAFDKEAAVEAEQILESRGVKMRTGVGVKEILGNEKATDVLLDNGEELKADAVILAMGYHPSTKLAEKSGLEINEMGFIKVDEYMKTNIPDILAVGDCAEKRGFFTGKPAGIMLASTACAEARIAAMNLYKLLAVKTFSGTIPIFQPPLENQVLGWRD
jgi:NADH oxidase (H2O2-forming)